MTDRRISASPHSQSTANTAGSGNNGYPKLPGSVLTCALGHPPRPANVLGSTRRANQIAPAPKMNKHNIEFTAADANDSDGANNGIMDQLLARLSEQSARLREQEAGSGEMLTSDEDTTVQTQSFPRAVDHSSSSNSVPITPATDVFPMSMPTTRPASASFQDRETDEEVARLRFQLAQAQNKLACAKTADNGRPRDHKHENEIVPQHRMPIVGRNNNLMGFEDVQPDGSDVVLGRAHRSIPFHPHRQAYPTPSPQLPMNDGLTGNFPPSRGLGQNQLESMIPYGAAEPFGGYRADAITADYAATSRSAGGRRNNRFPAAQQFGPTGYGTFSGPSSAGFYDNSLNSMVPMNGGVAMSPSPGAAMGIYSGFPQPALPSPLSPHATEFTSSDGSWRGEAIATEGQTYLPTTEPLNYRRLLDRSVNCNWKYIVDKIVCNNDQQASIFLQQKLKVSTPEQKYEIVEAIVGQAYPLMVNRFGNFLIQRCFEHGTPEQVIKIAEAIRGNTLNLSMDPFGCHVVQKAFDSVPEDYKAIMVHELLRRIPETVIHRYACHVWQKLFELRWQETPPQIMKYVNEALRGMWHEVALGETGSLVVQNIFENCLEEDKRPCVEEVLANIDIVAHGQFGNWCIQHICEHGAPADRSRAIDHVIRYASEYSTDQFASKVVEKCLKIGGPEFLGRYLDRVCEGRPDRPRIPLIDIASDQYGNYLIQYILTHANPQHRDVVMAHIRKHMVSLRGSKFGSRVGMLCTNPAVATRPGPGAGPNMSGPRMGRYGGMYR